MNEVETHSAALLNYNAVMKVEELRQFLRAQPDEELLAEAVGQALDWLLESGEVLVRRVEASK